MMKKTLLYVVIMLAFNMASAQQPALTWARNMGGKAADYSFGMAVDKTGNVYTTGYFTDTAVFDPGTGLKSLISAGNNDVFIQKTNASGHLLWVNKIGGKLMDMGRGIKVDEDGNIYTTGFFKDTVDFDPGAGMHTMAAAGSKGGSDIFILKLDSMGHFLWSKQLGGITADAGYAIALDASGNILTTGDYNVTADFDPGAGIFNLTSNGAQDIFISKLDANGDFLWAKSMGGKFEDHANSLVTDGAGNIYATGYFQDTADFDPGAGIYNLLHTGSQGVFIVKLSASGNFNWAKKTGGRLYSDAFSIALSKYGYIYTTGYFQDTSDFNPGTGILNLKSVGNQDIFILKLDTAGNFIWAKSVGSKSSDYGFGIALDKDDNSYITGIIQGNTDFDPGAGLYKINARGLRDQFIMKLDYSGALVWATTISSGNYVQAYSISLDAYNNFYCTGAFNRTADFNPGSGTFNLTPAGADDIFIFKMNQDGNTTGIEENTFSDNIHLYPNPTNGLLKLNMAGEINIEVYNTFGVLVFNQQDAANTIDLGGLTKGLYVVKIISENKVIAVQKLIRE